MINNEILSFIKEQIAAGSAKDQVKDMLVTQGGWDEKDVDEAFETMNFSGTSYPSAVKNAMADAIKSEEKEKSSGGAFAPASQLMQAVSGGAHPAVFSPGMSHMEQPKSMEPTLSASSPDVVSHPRVASPAPVAVSEASRFGAAPATGNNSLAAMNANIASGVPGTAFAGGQTPVFQPVIKEPVTSASFPKPSGAAPAVYQPAPAQTVANQSPFAGEGFGSPRQPEPVSTPGLAQSVHSSFPGKTAAPSLLPATSPMMPPKTQLAPSPQPMTFPKGTVGMMGNPHGSPTPAQLAVLRTQKGGGRFLFGFVMLLVGGIIGAVSMNAYMKGYVNAESVSGIVEKAMDTIGLGTPSVPSEEMPEEPAPEAPVDDGGS